MNHYHNYLIITEQRNLVNSKLIVLIKQFDVCTYFYENEKLFQIELILTFSFILFMIIICFQISFKKKYNKQEKIEKNTLGNFFINMIRILYWIMAHPLLLLSIQGIFQFQQMYWAFSFFISIFIICYIFFHDIILINDQFMKLDFLCISQKNPFIFTSWIKLIQCIFSSYFYSHQDFQIGYLSLCVGISFINYWQLQYNMVIFGKYDIDFTFHLVNTIYFSFNFGLLIQYFINIYDPYNLITVQIIIVFSIIHLNFRKHYFEQQFVKPRNMEIKLLLLQWYRELECTNVYYMGLIMNHYNHQNNKKCFLRHSSIFYSGKKFSQYTHVTTKIQNIEKKKSLFIKFLIKCHLETELKQQNIQNDDLIIKYSETLFYQFNLINESFKYLGKINKSINLNQQLRIQQLKLLINEKLNENNQQSFKGKLPFEFILKSEELMKEFNNSFLKITELQIYFWKTQLLNYIALQDTISICKNIQSEIKICQKSWKNIQQSNSNGYELIRFRWKFMYFYFKLYILHKKLKVYEIKQLPDINLKSQQIFQDEKIDERSSSEDETQNKQYYVTNCIISQNSIFFRVDKKGEIIQASQLVLKILGKHQSLYKGQRIEQLMPNVIKENHSSFLKLFNKTGQSENLYRRKSIHIKHVQGHCLKAQKYLKYIFNINSNRFEYISMIRQVQSRSQYMILNCLWEIDSLSEYLQQLIGDYKLQFLSLCPKAIAYSEYQEFLTNFDMKILSLKLCESGSRERIQDKKFTFKRFNDQTFSNKSIGELTSLVFKRELEEKFKKNVIQLFQQVLEEDNDIENISRTQRMNHVKFNIRIPIYKNEFIDDYQKFDHQCKQIFYEGEEVNRVVTRNENGRLRVSRTEFLYRYRWIKFQRKKFRYEKIKYLFENYCQERFLEKVIKVDANLKFYKTLNKISFIVIKVNRLELYDETTNQIDKQEVEHSSAKNFQPYFSSNLQEIMLPSQALSQNVTLKSQSGYRYTGIITNNFQDIELNSNRDSSRPFLADCNIREDFCVSGSNNLYSFDESKDPFIKEEGNKLQKSNYKLNYLLLINRGSIIYLILIISLSFFLCQYYYNPKIKHDSITMLGHLYKLQMIFVQSYNYIIDIALLNQKQLTSLLITNPTTKFNNTDQFYEFIKSEINNYYIYFYLVYQDKDFVQMVYQGFYSKLDNSNGLDVIDTCWVSHNSFNQGNFDLIDFNNFILEDYRSIMIPFTQELMYSTVEQRINDGVINLQTSTTNYTLFIFLQISILLFTIIFSLLIKFNLRQDINLIYFSIAKIPKEDKISAINQYQYLFYQIDNLLEEEYSGIKKKKTFFYKSDTIIQEPEEKETEKINQKRNKIQIKKLPKFKLQIVVVYLIYIIIIFTLFATSYYFILNKQNECLSFFQNNNFIKQTNYFWLIVLLKEKFVHENLQNSSFYSDLLKQRFEEFIDDVEKVNPYFYQTTINEANYIFDQSLCDSQLDESGIYIYYNKYCSSILQGVMNRGLKQFNILLYQVVTKALNPNDERYESFNIEDLSQYYISFQIIYEQFLNLEKIWAKEAELLLQQSLTISLILYILQLFILFISYIFLIEIYIFSSLKKDCKFSKKFYKYFMPNNTINQVKMMRVALVKKGLLQK